MPKFRMMAKAVPLRDRPAEKRHQESGGLETGGLA
jgi:hypothetical protein